MGLRLRALLGIKEATSQRRRSKSFGRNGTEREHAPLTLT